MENTEVKEIKAKRGGQEQTFPFETWREMPADKYGWIPVSEVPEEVAALQGAKQPEQPAANDLSAKEAELNQKEAELKAEEVRLNQNFESLKTAEDVLHERVSKTDKWQESLDKREQELIAKEEALNNKEAELNKKQAELEAKAKELASNKQGAGDKSKKA